MENNKTPKQMAVELLDTLNRKDAMSTIDNLIDDLRKKKCNSLTMVEIATQINYLNDVKKELNR